MKKHLPYIFIISLVMGMAKWSNGQCRAFTQAKCIPELTPYKNNGRINSTLLFNGDSATLRMTFFSLQDYQLRLCTGDGLSPDAYFDVMDTRGNILYTSKGKPKYWNFKVRSTRTLQIKVVVPQSTQYTTKVSDCASVVLGFKE